jgi:hypothetical protein
MFLINVLINVLIKQDRVKLQRSVFCPLIPLALQWFLRDWWFLGKCVTPALQHCSSATRARPIFYTVGVMGCSLYCVDLWFLQFVPIFVSPVRAERCLHPCGESLGFSLIVLWKQENLRMGGSICSACLCVGCPIHHIAFGVGLGFSWWFDTQFPSQFPL